MLRDILTLSALILVVLLVRAIFKTACRSGCSMRFGWSCFEALPAGNVVLAAGSSGREGGYLVQSESGPCRLHR